MPQQSLPGLGVGKCLGGGGGVEKRWQYDE